MIHQIKHRWADILAIGFLVAIVGVFFGKTITQGLLPVPTDTLVGLYHPWRDLYASTNPRGVPFKNFLITDPVRQQIPWRKIAIDAWKSGVVPGWNPYSFSGASLLANIQSASLYPFNILFFLLTFPDAWTILIVLQPLLSMVGMYFYLRNVSVSPPASVVGAMAWGLSGFNVAWLTWGTMGHVVLWLPFILLAIDRQWPVLLVISLVCQLFAGHAQISLYVITLAFFYVFYRRRYHLLVPFVFAGVIAAVQWGPLVQFMVSTGRVHEASSWMKAGWFVPWRQAVQFIAPDFFGNPATLNYWGEWNYGEFVGYIGVVGLVFALVSLEIKQSLSHFFQIVIGLVVLMIFPTFFSSLPYRFAIPILSSLQPTRMMVLIDYALAVLVALGMDHWMREKKNVPWKTLAVVPSVLMVLWIIVFLGGRFMPSLAESFLVSKRNLIFPTFLVMACMSVVGIRYFLGRIKIIPWLVIVLLIGISSIDLLRFGWKFTPFTPREYFFPETRAVAFFKQKQAPFRVMSLDARILPPNVSAYYNIETPEGYDPLIASRYEAFIASLNRGVPDIHTPYGFNRIVTATNITSPLFPLLQVRYVLSLDALVDSRFIKVFEEGQTKVYEYLHVLPRMFPVERVTQVTGEKEIITALHDPSFDPRMTAIVETPLSMVAAPVTASESVLITGRSPNSMIAQASLMEDHFVVLLQSYDPQWNVFIDGTPTNIMRTNDVFSGFVVPKGSHTIQLLYSPL